MMFLSGKTVAYNFDRPSDFCLAGGKLRGWSKFLERIDQSNFFQVFSAVI